MVPKSPAAMPPKMKAKTNEPNLKEKRKQVDDSETTASSLKSKHGTESAPSTPNQHQMRNKSSASGFKSQRSEPNLRKAGSTYYSKYSKVPHSPLHAPSVPELPRSKSNWTIRGTDKKDNSPRFMSAEQARSIRPVRYNPPPKIEDFKLPTIIGCSPTRSRFPELEPKHETRSERVLKAIRDPKGKMVKKYKGVMKQLSRIAMLKKMHKCLGTIKYGSSKQVKCKPLYRLRAIKRASMLLTVSGSQKPLSIAQIESILQANIRRLSTGSTMSRRMSVSHTAEGTAWDPENEKPEVQEGATVNEEEDEDRTVRESILLFREWLDLLQGTANSCAEDKSDEDFTSPVVSLAPPQQSSPSLPLTQDTLRSFQQLSPTDENRPRSSSPTSSEITITPANAHIFLKMSSSSRPASQDPFVDSTEAKRPKAGDGNNMPSPKIETRASHQAKDKNVRPYSRIPRGPASMQAQMPPSSGQKEAQSTPEPRSSIPLGTRAHGAEQMSSTSNAPVGNFSGGIRVVEKPRGPRPQSAERADPMEGSAGKIEMPERMSSSSGSSSSSGWVAGQESSNLQKPATVFTGEYRTRTLARSGSRLEGPKLKIASSAERLLMGAVTKGSDNADTQLSHSPEHSDSLECHQKETEDDDATPRAVPSTLSSHSQSAEQTPVTRNFCRPHNIGGSLRSNPVTPTQVPEKAFPDDIGTGPPSAFRFAYRSSSMQAVADFPLHSKAATTVTLTPQEATSQKRDISRDDLAAKALSQTQGSVRRFGNIRNIFKSSRGASEKARDRRQENEAPGAAVKEAVPDIIKARSKRNTKISPAQISPPMPMPMAIPTTEEETPSFARATASTRTRAEPPRDGRIRRANLAAMSTGSPQRRSGHRRSQVSMPQRVSTPSRVMGSVHDVAMVIRDEADAATKVADVGSCIEGLVAKARDAAAPGMREEYIRLALRLQKQLDEYKAAERSAEEAEAGAAKKRAARAEAETLLFAAFSGVLDQVGQ